RRPGDLGGALGAMDNLDPDLHRKLVELLLCNQARKPGRVLREPVLDHLVGDVHEALFCHVRDKPRVCPVVDNTGGRIFPVSGQLMEFHLPVIQGLLDRACSIALTERVPGFHGRVHVQHVVVMAPLDNLAAVDVPGKIQEKAAPGQGFGEDGTKVFRGDLPFQITEAPGRICLEVLGFILKIYKRDILKRYIDVPKQDGERALGHGAITDNKYFVFKVHPNPPGFLLPVPCVFYALLRYKIMRKSPVPTVRGSAPSKKVVTYWGMVQYTGR